METNFATELKNFDKDIKAIQKNSFLTNLELLFSIGEKVLNNFKSKLFPIKNLEKIPTREQATEPTSETTKATKPKTKRNISSLELLEEFLNEIKS